MPEIKNEFSTFDVMRILRIERGRLVHWMKGEFIPPGKLVKWGRGYKTVFSLYDLYSIALFKECVDFSLSRKIAKKYTGYVKWDEIIQNKYKFMLVQYKKLFVKQKHGPNAGAMIKKVWIEPEFLRDRKEMAKPYPSQIGIYINLDWILNIVNRNF
jgi:hypothetical protein